MSRLDKFRIQEEMRNVTVGAHTDCSNKNEVTIRKTANYDCEIIHELGNATWCNQHNENDQARIEEKEKTYSGLTVGISTILGKTLILTFP